MWRKEAVFVNSLSDDHVPLTAIGTKRDSIYCGGSPLRLGYMIASDCNLRSIRLILVNYFVSYRKMVLSAVTALARKHLTRECPPPMGFCDDADKTMCNAILRFRDV